MRMPDQRSTTDQLKDLAGLVLAAGLVSAEEARWVQTRGAEGSPNNLHRCLAEANRHGLYDAADWIRDWVRFNPEQAQAQAGGSGGLILGAAPGR